MKNTPQDKNVSNRHQSEERDQRSGLRVFAAEQNFQSPTYTGGCGKPAKFEHPSFREISREYFAAEESRSFAVEAAVFSALIAMAVLPIINSVQAVALLHTIGVL